MLYRFGSTGVVQVLARAASLLGLVPVFTVRNITSYTSGAAGGGPNAPVFRDCILMKHNSTVRDVARTVVGDAPLAFVETVGSVKVSEDSIVAIGKNDVSSLPLSLDFHGGRATLIGVGRYCRSRLGDSNKI